MPTGLKVPETFYSDIANNLTRWAYSPDVDTLASYYETEKYWYVFDQENTDVGQASGIVWLRRFEMHSPDSISCFSNHSETRELNKKWNFGLRKYNRVPLQ